MFWKLHCKRHTEIGCWRCSWLRFIWLILLELDFGLHVITVWDFIPVISLVTTGNARLVTHPCVAGQQPWVFLQEQDCCFAKSKWSYQSVSLGKSLTFSNYICYFFVFQNSCHLAHTQSHVTCDEQWLKTALLLAIIKIKVKITERST